MKSFRGILALAVLATMSACQEKDLSVQNKTPEVTDLVIPSDFDWNLSDNVDLSVESPVETVVDVFRSENCAEGDLLATLNVPTEEDVTLSVPVGTEKLYIRYTKVDGTKDIIITSPKAVVTRADNGNGIKAKLPEDAGKIIPSEDGLIKYYPANGWGTILFEDNWPVLGDYDLNDFAAWYKIQLYLNSKGTHINSIMVAVRLNALGGLKPYQLCLKIENLQTKYISGIEEYSTPTLGELVSEQNEPALFTFDWGNLKGSDGGSFYNTEKGHLAETLKDNQIDFIIELKEPIKLSKKFDHETFDFFIKRTDEEKTEIHMKGYKPTNDFISGYNRITNQTVGLAPNNYYFNDGNFVWGIKVPKGISHPLETVKMTEAYPEFATWLTSGGNDAMNWYDHKVNANCVEIK